MDVGAATDTVQTMPLMAQHGAAGVDADCCLAIDCSLNVEQLILVTDIFGTDFITQVKAVASQTHQSDGIAVRFPEHEFPCLSAVQLCSGLSVFEVQQGLTPLWMRSSAFLEDPKYIDEMKTRHSSVSFWSSIPT